MVDKDRQWNNDLCLLHSIVRVDSLHPVGLWNPLMAIYEGLCKLSAILKADHASRSSSQRYRLYCFAKCEVVGDGYDPLCMHLLCALSSRPRYIVACTVELGTPHHVSATGHLGNPR
jgi:hypothetical protein